MACGERFPEQKKCSSSSGKVMVAISGSVSADLFPYISKTINYSPIYINIYIYICLLFDSNNLIFALHIIIENFFI